MINYEFWQCPKCQMVDIETRHKCITTRARVTLMQANKIINAAQPVQLR